MKFKYCCRRAAQAVAAPAAAVPLVRLVGQAGGRVRAAQGARAAPAPTGCGASASARRASSATSNAHPHYQSDQSQRRIYLCASVCDSHCQSDQSRRARTPALVCVRVCASEGCAIALSTPLQSSSVFICTANAQTVHVPCLALRLLTHATYHTSLI